MTAHLERTGNASRVPGLLPPRHVTETSQLVVSRLLLLHPKDYGNAGALGARGWAGGKPPLLGPVGFISGAGGGGGRAGGGEGNPKLK